MLLKEVSESMKHIDFVLIKLLYSIMMNVDRMCGGIRCKRAAVI